MLEDRTLLSTFSSVSSVQMLEPAPITGTTSEKPQSKVWEHGGTWWSVFGDDAGTHVYRLDGFAWTSVLTLSAQTRAKADVVVQGDVTHVLIEKGSFTDLASIEYIASANTYNFWSVRPDLVRVPLQGVEAPTLDIDTTGRMWLAADNGSQIDVRYSDAPYAGWSAPITVATGISDDDISAVIAFDGKIGVLWSDQNTQRFGFRVHVDGDDPLVWSENEVPAGHSALDIGNGMADDHLNLAAAADGTLYAAVKTNYNQLNATTIGLLVRRPDGTWDALYEVDTQGTRPIVQLNETTGSLFVIYRETETAGPIVYRESSISTIAFGERTTLLADAGLNDPSSTKQNASGELIVIASTDAQVGGARLIFATLQNEPPSVDAGPDQSVPLGDALFLDATVLDDGLPNPPGAIATLWSVVSGPGDVTFADPTAIDTTATFAAAGTYVLRLTADDSELLDADDVSVTIIDATPAITVSLQDGVDGYAGTRDTRIAADEPDRNFGDTKLEIDGTPDLSALLSWDLSAIPAGSRVASASITLHVINTSPDTFELYQLLRPWAESQATFALATSTTPWEVAGAQGPSDRDSTVLGEISPTALGTLTIELNPAALAVIEEWINAPASNYGFIIQDYADTSNDRAEFRSSEAATLGERPVLTISYVRPEPQADNQPPTVDGGPDQSVTVGETLVLDATVLDDGLPDPPGAVTTTWSVVSGPGIVTFGDPSAVDTTAVFDAAGTYVLRLTADDSELTTTDDVSVTVIDATGAITIPLRDGVNGYAGTRDTRIAADEPDRNFAGAKLEIDGSPDASSLLSWDLSAIPPGGRVASASISLHVINTSPHTFELYRVLRPWVEFEANFHLATSSSSWEVPGAAGPGDRGSTLLGELTPAALGAVTIELNAAALSVIEGWINNPSSNFGFIIQDYSDPSNDRAEFRSREAATVGERPALTISYIPPNTVDSVPLSGSSLLIPDQQIRHDTLLMLGLPAQDSQGAALTWSAAFRPGDPLAQLAYQLDQTHQLRFTGNYSANWGGAGEKWMQSPSGAWYFITPDGGVYRWTGAAPGANFLSGSTRLATLDASYHADPARLHNAQQPQGGGDSGGSKVAVLGGSLLVVTPGAGFLGDLTVEVTGRGGAQDISASFVASVVNLAPELNLPDRTVSHTVDSVVIDLPATDGDGEVVTYTVELQAGDPLAQLAYELDQAHQLRFTGNYSTNWGGAGEKWMQSPSGAWYFITPDGGVYRWTGAASGANFLSGSTRLATLDATYHAQPSLLHDAQQPTGGDLAGSTAGIQNGHQLVVDPGSDFRGDLRVTVTATDGHHTISRSFNLSIVESTGQELAFADEQLFDELHGI